MEQSILNIISTGNPLAIIALLAVLIVYLVINNQRKTTAETRDSEIALLTSDIQNLNTELEKTKVSVTDLQTHVNKIEIDKKLLSKDIEFIKTEHSDLRDDIKEMKNTLNTMSLSLERLATKYEDQTANKKA